MPRISDILENFKGKKFFSIVDLAKGFNQFPITDRAKKLCNVITTKGIFQYFCVSFGLKNAPAFFQDAM